MSVCVWWGLCSSGTCISGSKGKSGASPQWKAGCFDPNTVKSFNGPFLMALSLWAGRVWDSGDRWFAQTISATPILAFLLYGKRHLYYDQEIHYLLFCFLNTVFPRSASVWLLTPVPFPNQMGHGKITFPEITIFIQTIFHYDLSQSHTVDTLHPPLRIFWGPHPMILRAYYWLYTKELLLVVLGDNRGCWESNLS